MSQRIHLDATPGLFHQVLHCHQGDVGRQFEIAVVTRDGYEIPSGATFKIQATKPSGLGFTVTGTAANNIISFTSTEDMTSEAGEIPTQLEIKSGNDVIYTSNFLLVCEKNTHPSSVTDGSPEEIISEITLLVERAETAASTAATDAANAAQARVDEMMDYLPSEVADLKSDLTFVSGNSFYTYTKDKSINANNLPNQTAESNWESIVVNCNEGDVFYVKGKGGSSTRLWMFASASGTLLTSSATGVLANDYVKIVAPANAKYLCVNSQYSVLHGALIGNTSLKEEADANKSKITNINANLPRTLVTYPNSGYINTLGQVVTNPNFFYSDYIKVEKLLLDVNIYWHSAVATFTFYDANKDYLSKYIKTDSGAGMEKATITIPDDAVYVVVCTDTTYENEVYVYTVLDTLQDIESKIAETEESYGCLGEVATNFANAGYAVCSCKKIEKDGKVTSIYVKSYSSGTANLYVGEVDQLYLFVPRKSFNISVLSGEQTIDVSDLDIYVNKGEQILYKFIGGKAPLSVVAGEPDGDNSFYYSTNGDFQLTVYGAQNAIVFGFGFTVTSSNEMSQSNAISENKDDIVSMQASVAMIQANLNIITDANGNKYRLVVQNGQVVPVAMDYKRVLCIGNSYTTHPTVDDTEPDYSTNLWWGHWAMAASDKSVAWTSLLQTVLRQKNNTATVTPVFGRRYETAPNIYTLSNPDTFTYWDGSAWQSLVNNLSNFADVDAVVLFLGVNYSGEDWYTLYSALANKFLEWFPDAALFCCSCSFIAKTANDTAIQTVANEHSAPYISMVGINGTSKIGSYVYGDDNILHQVDNSAVAGHFGDYGEYQIIDRICNAIGYTNNIPLRNISFVNATGATLSAASTKSLSGAVVSIFAEVASGTTLSSITVTDESNASVEVTDHGTTDYGRVFTFTMPSSDVTVTAVTA